MKIANGITTVSGTLVCARCARPWWHITTEASAGISSTGVCTTSIPSGDSLERRVAEIAGQIFSYHYTGHISQLASNFYDAALVYSKGI